ncbi:hypothetical protein [Streptosporangium sp. CA-115845]|uniref:hypothetical protein n=1 Tax=Streptosporangium sp. CA-115845 TaxID=3240071 RepID=UPI003D9412B9
MPGVPDLAAERVARGHVHVVITGPDELDDLTGRVAPPQLRALLERILLGLPPSAAPIRLP